MMMSEWNPGEGKHSRQLASSDVAYMQPLTAAFVHCLAICIGYLQADAGGLSALRTKYGVLRS